MLRYSGVLLLLLTACAGPKMVQLAAGAPTPMPTAVRGEQTQPLAVTISPAPAPAALAQPAVKPLPAAMSGVPVAARGGTAYYYDGTYAKGGNLTAFDLRSGAIAWRKAVYALPDTFVASPFGVAFTTAGGPASAMQYLDARTGAQRLIMPGTTAAGSIDGVVFGKNNNASSYFALDAKTGEKVWGTYGGGMQIAGEPQIHDGMLLQLFVNDGAIIEDALYAFDPANGHAKWNAFANAEPLGFAGRVVYVDSTWFPTQLDNYVPLSVAALDVRTGKKIDEYTYAPDPEQNADTYRNALPTLAYVSGGYVFLSVNHAWYRYDADRFPGAAHPSRLPGLTVNAAFENGTLLVSGTHSAYVASSTPRAMKLREFAGALRSPVVRGDDGTSYAVIGTYLYRFDVHGEERAIGRVNCASIQAVLPWAGNVAVLCAKRELRFADRTRAAAPLPRAPQKTSSHQLVLQAFTLPPPSGFQHQWWVGPLAPWRDNGVVMVLDHGDMALSGAIAFVAKDGAIRTVADGHNLPPPSPGARAYPTLPRSQWPPKPSAVTFDRQGNVWFNNSLWAAIYKLDAAGAITSEVVGETSPSSWKRGAIRLTLGPDGQVWFARSHPTREIARVDGSRTIPIPDGYGEALAIQPARDGFWFISQTQLVHVTLRGAFTATPLPPAFQNVRTWPGSILASDGGTIWIANGSRIARMNEHGTIAQYALPDATLSVNAMIAGCDGSLYVAENAPEVLRLPRGATSFERYDIGYRQLDGFTRTPDCTIWFAEGSNMPTQHVGTLRLK